MGSVSAARCREGENLKFVGFRILAVVISLAVSLAAIESVSAILLHFVRHQVERPEELKESLAEGDFPETVSDPYLLFKIRPQQKRDSYSTDSHGLRGEEFRPESKQLRVLLLGGSVAWSYLVRSDRETLGARLTEYLSRELERLDPSGWQSVIVLNAGVPAYVSRQAALYYARRLRVFDAHLVVSLDGVNDINASLSSDAGAPLFWNGGSDFFRRHPQALFRSIPRWVRYRLERSKLNRLRKILKPAPIEEYGAPSPREVGEAYFDTLHYLSTLTALDGTIFVPVLQPACLFDQDKPLTPFERELARLHETEIPGRNRFFETSYAAMKDTFPRISEAFDQVFPLDSRKDFQDETNHCFADCYHLTPRGIELLAEYVGTHLLQLLPSLKADS